MFPNGAVESHLYGEQCFAPTLQSQPQRHSDEDLTRLNMALSQDKWCSVVEAPVPLGIFFLAFRTVKVLSTRPELSLQKDEKDQDLKVFLK